jgi:DNA-binding MarR family transcriptional regulator
MLHIGLFDGKQLCKGDKILINRALSMEIRSLSNLIMRKIENSPIKKQVDSITGTNGWIIGYIAGHSDRDIFQKDFEKEFSITRSTASKVVNLMIQKGLLKHQSVPYDARLKKLVLTPKAMEIHQLVTGDIQNMEDMITKGFTKEELDNLYCYIEKMKNNLA